MPPRSLTPLTALLLVTVAGCIAHERPDGTEVDLCDVPLVRATASLGERALGVDVLVVVDSSASLVGLDEAVRNRVRHAVGLIADGDDSGDGVREAVPERSVRVAVVDMDMGVLDAASDPSCPSGDGDAAATHTTSPLCAVTSADVHGVLTYVEGAIDGDDFASEVVCAMRVGASGCRYARGMDALIAALDPARGLVRDGAQVFLLVVTGQNDCSTPDPTVFSAAAPPALRCHEATARLRPVDDVADAIVARLPRTELVTFSLLGGLGSGTTTSELLADPAMDERVDPATPGQLVPACATATAAATPARRWVELAAALEARGVSSTLGSVCAPPGMMFDRWFGSAAEALHGICLDRVVPVQEDAARRPHCDVTLTLPPVGSGALAEHCSELAFPTAYTLDHLATTTATDGSVQSAEVCRIRHVDDERMPGWQVGPVDACGMGIRFDRLALRVGTLDVTCDVYPLSTTRTEVTRGAACATEFDDHCARGRVIDGDETSGALACDAFTLTCQVPCASDADCTSLSADLRCDLRSPVDYFGADPPRDLPATRGFCFDAACDPSAR